MSLPSCEHTQHTSIPECGPHSSCMGRLNVITDEDMVRITPQAQILPELALIDCTLEELEADEPDWDLPWHCDVTGMLEKKRARTIDSLLLRHPHPLLQPFHIFDDASSLLSPQRRFEMEFGHAWNPDGFYLHYEIWRAMPEEDKAAGAFLTMGWISYVQSRKFIL
ncbi:hypothetical protein BT96DRAFT_1006567 [Gymnopus androsaceus JB14]|uniref:Uncharacterized protein n=1 Tax=Gymnopus androsaceus JB14 TaxID=1447944 RepID=A0A6A4GK88_9AGAR|nr:hypothetical protein BT96DRAFT_1006567 [Gymnopus androsaceus JB14]